MAAGLGSFGGDAEECLLLPNVISYNAVVSACEKGQQGQQALGLLAVMQRTAVLPNVISYSAAISACENGQLGCRPWL